VQKAIAVLEQHGFIVRSSSQTSDVFAYGRLVNRYVGHRDAYAATNFPFEVVTLYPEFFTVPVDERAPAAVLLARIVHLIG